MIILLMIMLLWFLIVISYNTYRLAKRSVLFEDGTNKAIAELRLKTTKTPYGGSEEPEAPKAVIIDPENLSQQIEFEQRQYNERLARLNPK